MATLYELTEEYRQLLEMMEDDTVDPEVLQDTLEGVDGEIEAKADNCAKLIRELNGVTSVINEEIERLKARKDVISNNADRVKKYLEKAMIDTGKRKFKTALFGFNIQKNPASVVVDQEDKIPEAYTYRDDLTIIFTAHTQTDHDEAGYMFTRIKTSGKKLDKICLESKFTTVLLSKCVDGAYKFETQANNSTAKSPMGAFDQMEIDNDIVEVMKALEDY